MLMKWLIFVVSDLCMLAWIRGVLTNPMNPPWICHWFSFLTRFRAMATPTIAMVTNVNCSLLCEYWHNHS